MVVLSQERTALLGASRGLLSRSLYVALHLAFSMQDSTAQYGACGVLLHVFLLYFSPPNVLILSDSVWCVHY